MLNLDDPDYQSPAAANPPSYEAVRLPKALYVEYAEGTREYYDLRTDPYELDNTYASLSKPQKVALHRQLAQLESCHGTEACAAPLGPKH